MDSPLPISDEELIKLLRGPPHDVDAAVTIIWNHLSRRLAAYALSILPPELAGDCQDVVSEAFVKLLAQPAKVAESINGSLAGWFMAVVRNTALDRCRKAEVRERHLTDPSVGQVLRPPEAPPPDEQVQHQERLQQRRSQLAQLNAALDEAATQMGAKQKEVAMLMLKLFRETAGWPTAGRIHEELAHSEPDLRPETVKERRKDVMSKFNTILNDYGRRSIPE
jgi:RNA polymerase sigma factor (sigma-70 family)